jgi:hypothetical protein
MPRGSRPGERRGGRQKGTPNKKTVLLKAAINATASHPNVSPLDFLLGLMRDPNLPLEVRVTVAEAALPLVHSRPKELPPDRRTTRKYRAPQNGVNAKKEANSSAHDTEAAKVSAVTTEGGADLSPLDFLLSVMRGSDVAAHLRIKVASIVAPFVHPKRRAAIIDDPYGFDIDPELASVIWENADWSSHPIDSSPLQHPRVDDGALEPRIAERLRALKCPEGYGGIDAKKDTSRLVQLSRAHNALTKKEDAEAAHLAARLEVYKRSPEGKSRQRIEELGLKRGNSALTGEERSEHDRLKATYPDLPEDPHPLAHIVPHLTRAIEKYRAQQRSQGK